MDERDLSIEEEAIQIAEEEAKLAKLKRDQLGRSYKKVFSGADGKLVLDDLLSSLHLFHSTFRGDNGKVQDYLEGRRSVALYIISQLEIADIGKIKKLKEI